MSFEVAWRGAGRRVRWPHDTATRLDWKDAMDDTREAWETAYNEMPSALPALTDRVIELVA